MTRYLYGTLILAFSFLLVSCATQSTGQEENASSETSQFQEESLSTPEGSQQVSQPVVVDLADVEAGESNNTGAVEAPAPGQRHSEESLIHFISLDVSKRLGIDISQVKLLENTSVTWSDGSLGCPEEGVSYTQAEVPGYQITVEAKEKEYIYHTEGLVRFIWCDEDSPVPPLD